MAAVNKRNSPMPMATRAPIGTDPSAVIAVLIPPPAKRKSAIRTSHSMRLAVESHSRILFHPLGSMLVRHPETRLPSFSHRRHLSGQRRKCHRALCSCQPLQEFPSFPAPSNNRLLRQDLACGKS